MVPPGWYWIWLAITVASSMLAWFKLGWPTGIVIFFVGLVVLDRLIWWKNKNKPTEESPE